MDYGSKSTIKSVVNVYLSLFIYFFLSRHLLSCSIINEIGPQNGKINFATKKKKKKKKKVL